MVTLLNKTAEIVPETFFVFVNLFNPMTFYNFQITKTFHSAAYTQCIEDKDFAKKYLDGTATYVPFNPNNENDLKFLSPYHLTAIRQYANEYSAERTRFMHYQIYPSRLSALYAFGDYQTCIEVSKKYGWDLSSVKEFKLVSNDSNVRVVRVNMEIVSLMNGNTGSLNQETTDMIWHKYWSGEGNVDMEIPTTDFKRKTFSSGIIWEYLIEGALKSN
jgi:hypothetical protein